MKNKYKVVALVPLEFSVEGNSDSKEAIESVKNIFKACRGQPSQCHANSAYLWDANRGHCSIATGYALSEDGLWRCHSWVVQPRSRTMRVWETTVKRVAYFGFVMNDTECQEFLDNNT